MTLAKQYAVRYAAVLVIVAVVAFFGVMTDNFLTANNFNTMLRSMSISTFAALAVTFSLTVDGFDVSIGSVASLAVIVSASVLILYGGPIWFAIVLSLLIGALVGLINACLVVFVKLPDLLATLAMLFVVQGVQMTYTEGGSISKTTELHGQQAVGPLPESFRQLAQGEVFGLPTPTVLLLVVVVIAHLFLNRTAIGRRMYMVGGNREAARHFGFSVGRLTTLAYVISGVLAAIGGVILLARVGHGQTMAASGWLMDGVAAAYVGYAIFGQRKPSVIGTVLAAFLIQALSTGLIMMQVPYYAQDIVKGGVFILALAFAFVRKDRSP